MWLGNKCFINSRLWVFSGTLFFPASLKSRDPSRSLPLKPPRRTARKGQQQLDGMGNQRARSRGLRHGTRNMFSRPFRKKGTLNATTFLRTFRVSTASRIASRDPPAEDVRRARRAHLESGRLSTHLDVIGACRSDVPIARAAAERDEPKY